MFDIYWWYNTIGGLVLTLVFVYVFAKVKINYDKTVKGEAV